MSRKKGIKLIIVTLLLLVAAVFCFLFTFFKKSNDAGSGKSESKGNKISALYEDSAVGKKSVTAAEFYGGNKDNVLLGEEIIEEEQLKLTERGKDTVCPFDVQDMYPGDSVKKYFTVTVKDPKAKTLFFGSEIVSGEVPGDKLSLKVSADGLLIYKGQLSDITEKTYPVTSPCDVQYEIEIALDKTAGNEYANLDINVTFTWSFEYEEIETAVITYSDGMGGAVFAPQEITTEKGKETPKFQGTPEREGFVFAGWYPEPAETVTESITYTAKWALEVLFTADGKTIETDVVNLGYKVGKHPVPFKAGYGFAGWYLDSKYTVKFNFNSPIREKTILYARFFLWGDVDMNGAVTANDANLVSQYVKEIDNPNIKNIMAGRVSSIRGIATANDANFIANYVKEAIDFFPVEEICRGYEFDLEKTVIIPPNTNN